MLPGAALQVLWACCRNIPGLVGLALRYVLIRAMCRRCGQNIAIYPNTHIFHIENLELGDNVSIHPMSYIDAAGTIKIGSDVSIAHGVTVMSSTHVEGAANSVIRNNAVDFRSVSIGSNVWIGAKATILCGISIGDHSIIGASSVVTKPIPAGSMAHGVPAKIIRKLWQS